MRLLIGKEEPLGGVYEEHAIQVRGQASGHVLDPLTQGGRLGADLPDEAQIEQGARSARRRDAGSSIEGNSGEPQLQVGVRAITGGLWADFSVGCAAMRLTIEKIKIESE